MVRNYLLGSAAIALLCCVLGCAERQEAAIPENPSPPPKQVPVGLDAEDEGGSGLTAPPPPPPSN